MPIYHHNYEDYHAHLSITDGRAHVMLTHPGGEHSLTIPLAILLRLVQDLRGDVGLDGQVPTTAMSGDPRSEG